MRGRTYRAAFPLNLNIPPIPMSQLFCLSSCVLCPVSGSLVLGRADGRAAMYKTTSIQYPLDKAHDTLLAS